ncbi:MAG: response regulator [Campylobacterales bacterium]|nr:response regulator [Campylobacterales bacterium]
MNSFRVAIVDDSATMRMIIKKTLVTQYSDDVEVFELENGKKFIEQVDKIKPDIVLLDWNMPEMDGFETLKILKEEEEYQETIVIMITSDSRKEKVKLATKEGLSGYIIKPFDRKRFLDMMEKVVEHLNSK